MTSRNNFVTKPTTMYLSHFVMKSLKTAKYSFKRDKLRFLNNHSRQLRLNFFLIFVSLFIRGTNNITEESRLMDGFIIFAKISMVYFSTYNSSNYKKIM